MEPSRKLLYAYVDETGDRGVSARSSRFFAMAGLVMAAEQDPLMRATIDRCATAFDVPPGKPLHWADHVKTYARRQFVANALASVPEACVNYVIIEKAAIPVTAGMYGDHTIFYNYVAGLMLERLLFTADTWPGGPRNLVVRFGHVRGFDHTGTLSYFDRKRRRRTGTPWDLLRGKITFVNMGRYRGLQAADQYCGMLTAATVPDVYGGYEEHHLLKVVHQVRRHRGTAWGSGLKVMALPGSMEGLPWWKRADLGAE